MLPGGPGAEVRTGDENRRPRILRLVQDERGVVTPGREQAVLETGLRDPLEIDRRDDLVGVDVAATERQRGPCVGEKGIHDQTSCRSAGAPRVPSTAVAAATWGETRWVRPPLPCRPSKLRFEVDAERSPGASWSGFIPRHIEQPACRHSAPAAVNTLSRPSSTACSATRTEPGTTSMRTPSATLRPWTTDAAARRSSIRPLVHEPTNTVSTATSRSGCPALRPMYSSAFSAASRSPGSAKDAGSGTDALSGAPWPGLVPQVTNGASEPASIRTSWSKTASSSVRSVFQYAPAASQSSPLGAWSRPSR